MNRQSKTEILDVGESGFFDDDDLPNQQSYGGYAMGGDSTTQMTNMSINTNNSIVRGGNKNFNAQPYNIKSTQNINNRQPMQNKNNMYPSQVYLHIYFFKLKKTFFRTSTIFQQSSKFWIRKK